MPSEAVVELQGCRITGSRVFIPLLPPHHFSLQELNVLSYCLFEFNFLTELELSFKFNQRKSPGSPAPMNFPARKNTHVGERVPHMMIHLCTIPKLQCKYALGIFKKVSRFSLAVNSSMQ